MNNLQFPNDYALLEHGRLRRDDLLREAQQERLLKGRGQEKAGSAGHPLLQFAHALGALVVGLLKA